MIGIEEFEAMTPSERAARLASGWAKDLADIPEAHLEKVRRGALSHIAEQEDATPARGD
jgi:hypothetical protein